MIKSNELRIGNFVKTNTDTIVPIRGGGINAIELGQLVVYPIDLNEDWLLKFGFSNPKHSKSDYANHYMMNGLTFGCWEGKDVRFTGILDGKKLSFVHELQNLYFCLCGQELEIVNS